MAQETHVDMRYRNEAYALIKRPSSMIASGNFKPDFGIALPAGLFENRMKKRSSHALAPYRGGNCKPVYQEPLVVDIFDEEGHQDRPPKCSDDTIDRGEIPQPATNQCALVGLEAGDSNQRSTLIMGADGVVGTQRALDVGGRAMFGAHDPAQLATKGQPVKLGGLCDVLAFYAAGDLHGGWS